MLAVRNGDAEKFGMLFDRYHQSLFSFFYRLSGDAASSEDLVQDVFLRMLKYRRSFRPDSQFRPWMYQIARAARIDRFRKHRSETLLHDEETLTGQFRGPRPDEQLEETERMLLLQKALLQLPDDKRELLVLARFLDLDYGEIAALLQVEAGTVKVRVHRAMNELRTIVQRISGEQTACNVTKPDPILPTT
jgi:RNA polymerase sigma-70 factor (ECF subfamily)